MSNTLSVRDLPLVLTLRSLLPFETLSLAGITSIKPGATIVFELFKVSEARRMLAYQSVLNCLQGKCLEVLEVEQPDHLKPAVTEGVSSPTPGAGSAEQAIKVTEPAAVAPAAAPLPPAPPAEVPVAPVAPVAPVEAPAAPEVTTAPDPTLVEAPVAPEAPASEFNL